MRKKFLIVCASICVIMGTIGVFVPMWPTTPFLLLAIFLYMRSSKRGVKRILSNKMLAPYVKSYFAKSGIPTKVLLRTVTLLWITLAIAMLLCRNNATAVIILFLVGTGVSVHLYGKRSKQSNG